MTKFKEDVRDAVDAINSFRAILSHREFGYSNGKKRSII